METEKPERYCVADLLVDATTRQITRDGREIPLPALSFDLFLALLRRAPAVVSTDRLMELVWPGRVVNVETIAKRVELVREALGDDSRAPRYIALVRRRGYRLIPTPQPFSTERVASGGNSIPNTSNGAVRQSRPLGRWTIGTAAASVLLGLLWWSHRDADPTSAATERTPSIAVLPFANLSEDPDNAYFSDGIAEELLTMLSRLPKLRVASRTSSFALSERQMSMAEIGRTLKVRHIVEGSVRRAGNRIRITAQLIDVETDSHLWAQTYDRQLADIFEIQREISAEIAAALQMRIAGESSAIGPHAGTGSIEAFQLYLRGRQFWYLRGENNIRQSIQLLTRAIELDANFARAHAALAQALATTIFYYKEPDPQASSMVERAAMRAIELDPTLSESYAALGLAAGASMDWQRAETSFRRAIDINANDATAWYWLGELYSVTGRTREALDILLRAAQLDPISPPLLLDIGELYLRNDDYKNGCPYVRRSTEVGVSPYASMLLAHCHEHSGDLQASDEALTTAERLAGLQQPVLVLVRQARHDPAQRAAALAAIRYASQSNFNLPMQSWELGDADAAFDAIEKPLQRHNFNHLRDLWSQRASGLRSHPRFLKIVQRAGLLTYWRHSGWPDVCRPSGDSFACD